MVNKTIIASETVGADQQEFITRVVDGIHAGLAQFTLSVPEHDDVSLVINVKRGGDQSKLTVAVEVNGYRDHGNRDLVKFLQDKAMLDASPEDQHFLRFSAQMIEDLSSFYLPHMDELFPSQIDALRDVVKEVFECQRNNNIDQHPIRDSWNATIYQAEEDFGAANHLYRDGKISIEELHRKASHLAACVVFYIAASKRQDAADAGNSPTTGGAS